MNQPMMIEPYWSSDLSTWVFDDPAVELEQEPFVKGATVIIDELVRNIPDARDGFRGSSPTRPSPVSSGR